MTLSVRFTPGRENDAGMVFSVCDVSLRRAMGEPVVWTYTVYTTSESRSVDDMRKLAELLEKGPVYAHPLWKDSSIGLAGVVVCLEYENQSRTLLRVEAQATYTEQTDPDPFLPRRRVHRVKNLQELIDIFDPIVKVSKGVRNKFAQIEFKDKDHAAVIQDHWSDWAFVHYTLRQYHSLQKEHDLKPLVISGSLNPADKRQGHWVIDWGHENAFEILHDKQQRIIDFSTDGGYEQLLFSYHNGYRHPDFQLGKSPAVIRQRRARSFKPAEYKNWVEMDLPLFVGEHVAMVWKVEDYLNQSGRPDRASWSTKLYTCTRGTPILGMQQASGTDCLRPWFGFAKVVESSELGPWIKVKLTDFEENEDMLDLRLMTPYSGTDGRKGWHTVPEKDTHVLVGWSGRYGDSITYMANVRDEAVDLANPSLWLEKTFLMRTADVETQDLGRINVHPDLNLQLNKTSSIKGYSKMELDVDGTDVRLAGGTFYTGKA